MHFCESPGLLRKSFHLENSKTTMLLLLLIMNFVPENGKKPFLQQKTWNTNYIFLTVMTHVSAVVTMLYLKINIKQFFF